MPGIATACVAMYGATYVDGVRRTNIYLTDVEQAGLDARAAAAGVTRSDLVRALIDRELNLGDQTDLDAVLVELAGELAAQARSSSSNDPDLRM
jgi:hypothetical protein